VWPAVAVGAAVTAGALAYRTSPVEIEASVRLSKPVSGPPPAINASPTFVENFDGPELDSSRWQTSFAEPSERKPTIAKRNLWNNRERQVYFDSRYLGVGVDPFRIENGVLTIEARPLDQGVLGLLMTELGGLPGGLAATSLADVAFSSGMVSTRGRFTQRYGYFEMRARWSRGKGLWPAFWLLPAGGGWPPEIDVVEAHGDKPRETFHSLHLGGGLSTTERVLVANPGSEFRTYGVLWLPDRLDYYVDSEKVASIPILKNINEAMFLVANLAIGGAWPGDPDASTAFPARLEIDHIRVWKVTP
jgi:hypothetical protein